MCENLLNNLKREMMYTNYYYTFFFKSKTKLNHHDFLVMMDFRQVDLTVFQVDINKWQVNILIILQMFA